MLKLGKAIRMVIAAVIISYGFGGQTAYSDDYEPVKSLVDKYNQTGDHGKRKDAADKLSRTEPKSHEDMDNLRKIFSKKEWDEYLYGSAVGAIERLKDKSLDDDLIEILKDEKPLMEKTTPTGYAGKSDKELRQRGTTVMFAIKKLGEHKSENAVPVLKDYLKIKGFQYMASEALGKIGDKSASEDIREKAYKGEEVNYGGMGTDESRTIIRDLEDKSKKDNWKKIARQLIKIRSREVKPDLKRLFDHEDYDIRRESAIAFSNMVDRNDVDDILIMVKHKDFDIRNSAIYAMMRLKDVLFSDVLINILANDVHRGPRSQAARALGYIKVEKAVPYLEIAIKDKDYYVRLEAYISLYVLTGKKYDFEGKDQTADSMAEKQRTRPSIFW